MVRRSLLVLAIAAGAALPSFAREPACEAAPKDKERDKDECVDAHSKGQDLRDKGQLTRARQVFLSCAQSSCPSLIQGDCARFGEDLDRLVPTVSFSARDAKATDLPNTSVFVDDVLVATRLDDGKAYDVDPGKHTIRFVHDGKETTLSAVVTQGEKGRVLIATFVDRSASTATATADIAPSVPQAKRPVLPLVVAGIGAAALVTGGVLLGLGLHQVPSSCSVSSKECAAAPGDAAFADAHAGTSLANLGLGVGLGGAAMLVGGVVWYLVQPATLPTTESGRATLVSPFFGRDSGGVAVRRSF